MKTKINTDEGWRKIIAKTKDLFLKKDLDYGRSWTVLRTESLTDQIFIKARRLRELEDLRKQNKQQKVADSFEGEYFGIINYCIMGIIKEESIIDTETCSHDELAKAYDKVVDDVFELMQNKNHDYGEAWRDLRVPSITDLILQKLFRVRQMQDNNKEVKVSEPPTASFKDMINYSIFALILIEEQN